MKQLFIIISLFISVATFSQNSSIPTIRVTGSAMVKVKPDLGVINIQVAEVKQKMSDAIKALIEKSKVYDELLQRIGIDKKDIKTTSFQIAQNRLYKNNEHVDSGYIASQKIRVEFNYEQKLLQKIVGEFSNSESPIDFDIQFVLSEQLKSKVQSQVIESSVKDATVKAYTITKASGLKLVKILTITYGSWDQPKEMEQVVRTSDYAAAGAAEGGTTFNFTPDELVFKDALTIEWIIK
jgi:uncharacterized protein YggE